MLRCSMSSQPYSLRRTNKDYGVAATLQLRTLIKTLAFYFFGKYAWSDFRHDLPRPADRDRFE
jgi:uncharacterized membrane protein